MNVKNLQFELVENEHGHAAGSTIMSFTADENPFRGSYKGPNVVAGQMLLSHNVLVYHSLDTDGNLRTGQAKVHFDNEDGDTEMILEWEWLDGDKARGVSHWHLKM